MIVMQVKSIAECSKELLSTLIKLPIIIKIFVLSLFEWAFYTGFTLYTFSSTQWIHINKEHCRIGWKPTHKTLIEP